MLKAQNIHKIYKQPVNDLHVLKGVNLELQEQDILSIVGPSGAGKSTLLHILGGLDKPNDGQVFFEGQDIYKITDNKRTKIRNQKIGFIFQFYHLLGEFSALENVVMPGFVKEGMAQEKLLKQKASQLLERVGLGNRIHHKPHELSGGEQQRVAIARALINDPKVIFCDEPTGNLDSENGKIIIALLMELNEEHKQTIVIVTHDEEIAKNSKKVIHMRDGILV